MLWYARDHAHDEQAQVRVGPELADRTVNVNL